ncbi:sodium channel protein Nach isoform X1 [Leptinotarsa decemlineata]|uniref:sodium channel protein Nach isoform X1 n=1 Tax=Leptinotarsa decemlineata TaxID=7539 RepID=UPI003D30A840
MQEESLSASNKSKWMDLPYRLERLLWTLVILIAAIGAVAVSISNLSRFLANPTVVSIQKDYRNWNNHFPTATGCFINKVDLNKAESFIYRRWRLTPEDERYPYYLEFVKLVTNSTFYNFDLLTPFQKDPTLRDVDMGQLAVEVHPNLSGTLVTIERNYQSNWQLIMTEVGICFTFNSKFVQLLSPNASNPKTSNELKCHFLNGVCYARYDSDPTLPLKYYIHSYIEFPHTTSKVSHEVEKGDEIEINYRMIEADSSPDIKYLSPSQRMCRFDDEPITNDVTGYSLSICYTVCRYKLALKLCGCKPFFYHFLAKGKVCDISGLICLSKYATQLTREPSQLGCTCPQPCHLISYLPLNPKYTKWNEGGYFDERIAFRWGLLHPTTKYRRDILFGFGDLIVSLGGTFNLFLGISFISIIEAIYLIFKIVIRSIQDHIMTKNRNKICVQRKLPLSSVVQ